MHKVAGSNPATQIEYLPRSSVGLECRTTNVEVAGSSPAGVVRCDWFCSPTGRGGGLRNRSVQVRILSEPLMVNVAQLVRASDCESEGYGFNSRRSPFIEYKSIKE